MSLHILDTDTLSHYQRGHPKVCHRASARQPNDLAITVITVEEQLSGWYTLLRKAKRRDELARVYQRLTDNVQFLAGLQIHSYTEPAIERYDQLKALTLKIGKMDLRIAAIAQERGATLVTRNLRDFQRIPNLALEDWTA